MAEKYYDDFKKQQPFENILIKNDTREMAKIISEKIGKLYLEPSSIKYVVNVSYTWNLHIESINSIILDRTRKYRLRRLN